MESNKLNLNKRAEIKKDSTFWMSMFILIIMVFSTLGFALMSGGGSTSSSDGSLPSEVVFQQFENEGQVFWGAIKNNEQFIFMSIDGFDADLVSTGLANKIKSQTSVELYIDDEFTSSDALYLIEKALRGLKIKYNRTNDLKCESNTLVFMTNSSIEGDCIKFISNNDDAYLKAETLTYHLVK